MQDRRIAVGLAAILVLQGMDRARAQEPAAALETGRVLHMAPVNPEFKEYLRAVQAGERPERTADGHTLGLIPSPLDLSHLSAKGEDRTARDPSLPASYDLRTRGKVSPVGNQNPYGTCWSFATYGAMESCLLPETTASFSENNLVNLAGFDLSFGGGGNGFMSAAYLTRWSGPVLDSDDPYYNVGGSPTNIPVQRHVQQIRILPNRDYNAIKRAVMDYGGVYTSLHWKDPCYNRTNSAYYCTGTNRPNHAVTAVGWDDNYDRTRFKPPAPHDGAWIMKNSWDTGWGEEGYFYCSYDDTRVGRNNFVFMNAEPTNNYARIYQYDPLGVTDGYGDSQTAWGANLFVGADGDPTTIKAVSFFAVSTNMSYQVFVYTGTSDGEPRSGTLQTTATGTLEVAGYYTVPLDPPAPLAANERFSVVVRFTTPGFNYPLGVEFALKGFSSKATAAAGQSFYSPDGANWQDIIALTGNPTINLCIKAFASAPVPPPPGTAHAGGATPGPAPRTGEPTAIETTAGRQFKLVTPSGEAADFFLGFSPSPDEADLRLMYSGSQRTFATMFEGKWVTIGTPAAPKTFGKSFILEEAVSAQDGVQWVFTHKLKSGQSCGIYQKRDGKWANTHTVTCK